MAKTSPFNPAVATKAPVQTFAITVPMAFVGGWVGSLSEKGFTRYGMSGAMLERASAIMTISGFVGGVLIGLAISNYVYYKQNEDK